MIKLCKIHACPTGTLGLHLSRAPWDPYPWVSGVQESSNAYHAGMRCGDTVLQLNGADVVGMKISQLAVKIRTHWEEGKSFLTFQIWRNSNEPHQAINQQSLQKFATCLQSIAQLLECPVCLEVVKPPGWQCCNGHVLCNSCRGRTVKCPICRVTLGPRGRCLLSDKLFTLLAESFPCDGVKSGPENGQCPRDYHNHHKAGAETTTKNEIIISKQGRKGLNVSGNSSDVIKLKLKSDSASTDSKRNYHCPTGKLCFEIAATEHEDVEDRAMPSRMTIVANKICKNFVSRPKREKEDGEDNDGNVKTATPFNSSSATTKWHILSHLTLAHQISVLHYHGTFGQRIRVDFMHTKSKSESQSQSISCISLSHNVPIVMQQPVGACTGRHRSDSMAPSHKTSSTPGNGPGTTFDSMIWKKLNGHKTNKSTWSHPHPSTAEDASTFTMPDDSDSNSVSASTGDCQNVVFSSHAQNRCTEHFFIAQMPIEIPYDNDDNKSARMSDGSHGPDRDGSPPPALPPPPRTLTDRNSNLTEAVADADADADAVKVGVGDNANGKRCAIFIWYCGTDADVKKFQTVIECKLSGNKWTGSIHPLTKSWNAIFRSKEFLQFRTGGDVSVDEGEIALGDCLDFYIHAK